MYIKLYKYFLGFIKYCFKRSLFVFYCNEYELIKFLFKVESVVGDLWVIYIDFFYYEFVDLKLWFVMMSCK